MLFEGEHSQNDYFHKIDFIDLYSVPHCHKSFEILFVLEGSVRTVIHEVLYEVDAGSCVLILPYEIHSYETPEYSKNFISIFSIDYISDFYDMIKNKSLCSPVMQYTEEELKVMHHPEERFAVKSVLYRYCSRVLEGGVITNASVTGNDLMCKILLYIQDHYKSDISLKSLSDALGYSYSYLSAYFHKNFGIGFSEYVNRFRLEEAAQLLKNTDMNVTQAAMNSGFTTIRNFNLTFKKRFHVSPSDWAEEMRDGK